MKEFTLREMKPGEKGKVLHLESPEKGKLMALGILPGITFEVIRKYPALILRLGFTEVALDLKLAEKIIVKRFNAKYLF